MLDDVGGGMTPKAQSEILRQQVHASFPYLIEITYDDYGTFRYANSDDDLDFEGNTYTACTFSVAPPDKTESKIGDGKLTFSAIYNNREWIKKIRQTQKRGKIRVVGAILYAENYSVDGIEAIYDTEYTLSDVSWNESELTFTMKFDDGMDIVMPCDTIDELTCPGVV